MCFLGSMSRINRIVALDGSLSKLVQSLHPLRNLVIAHRPRAGQTGCLVVLSERLPRVVGIDADATTTTKRIDFM